LAPTSDSTDNPAALAYWIVDRHEDNNARTPPPNDGLLYEISLATSPPQRTLTVQVQGAGSGTVTAPGISCPGDCTESYDEGQQVTLTATAADGSFFEGWSGACSGSAPCPLTMHADEQATAIFDSSPSEQSVTIPISTGANDADETEGGTIHRSTADIELGTGSGSVPATAALRFTGVQIPRGAAIVAARVQFTTDEVGKKATTLELRAERADDSPPITTSAFNISSRPRTVASIGWSVPAWQTLATAGPAQLTPNLAQVLQEVVDRPGWASGNALTVIITGSGRRTAESFEGGAPPILRVDYIRP
jgi:hypothetical protein